jgi:hypothetical protein
LKEQAKEGSRGEELLLGGSGQRLEDLEAEAAELRELNGRL